MIALDIFKNTMSLADQLDESGEADIPDNYEYKYRSVSIINTLANELYPYSDTYVAPKKSGKRSTIALIETLDDDVDLDDYICTSVLPYGLAAHLMLEEDPQTANFFQQRYEELKMRLRDNMLAESEDIEDVYSPYGGNGIGFEWTTRW